MTEHRQLTLHLPRYAVWALAAVILGPWIVVVGWISWHRRPAETTPLIKPASISRNSLPAVTHAHAGPWGDLQTMRILLEPPEEFILGSYTEPAPRPWVFKGYTEASLAELWNKAGLSASEIAMLNHPTHREVRPDAILIRPDTAFILGLSTPARTTIYTALGEFSENISQFNPYRLRTSVADTWLDNVDAPDEAIALTKKLLYPRGTATCFSDEAVVLPLITDATARVRYLKALSRKSGLLVYLNVHPNDDVDKLVGYWARGGRSKDLKPLLQSLARNPNGGQIDIVHLLPRFARLLTYTYPLPSDKPIDANHDCHWTSFNFQNDEPDERFSAIEYVRQVLDQQYYPVPGDPMLGDIIMFVRPDGVVVHSCVYIADDIVFTKNGPAYSVPWLLSPLADVQAFYAANGGVEIRRFRAKNL